MNEKKNLKKRTSENHVTGGRKEEEGEKNETAFTIPYTEFCLVMSAGQFG